MKVLKGLLITLFVIVIITAVLFGLACLFKELDWLPGVTDWLTTNIFDKLGITFFSKL